MLHRAAVVPLLVLHRAAVVPLLVPLPVLHRAAVVPLCDRGQHVKGPLCYGVPAPAAVSEEMIGAVPTDAVTTPCHRHSAAGSSDVA